MKGPWVVAVVAGLVVGGGVALAQMGSGQPGHGMGPGQPSPEMGPGRMMMGHGGQPGAGMGPGSMMGSEMMGAGSANDRPWISFMLEHREDLALSAEQIGKLFTLRDTFAKETRKKSQDLANAERALNQMLGPGPVDLRAVEAKVKEAEGIRTDLRLARVKVIEEGKGVLTADQRKKLVDLAKQPQRPSEGTSHGHSMGTTGGMGEMHEFMHSERGAAAMDAMMQMARRMGSGDAMRGMVRMMEMMGGMGGMMGTPGQPAPAK